MQRLTNLKALNILLIVSAFSALTGCAEGVLISDETETGQTSILTPNHPADSASPQAANVPDDSMNAQPSEPLKLVVESPLRGASLDNVDVQVSGRIDGLGSGELLVNGQSVTVDARGRFSTMVVSGKGLNRIVTEARRGQVYVLDRRAYIFGARRNSSDKIERAITIHLGAEGLGRIGEIVSRSVEDMDLGEMIRDSGGDSDEFKVKEVDFSGVDVQLIPEQGQIKVRLDIRGLEIKFRGKFNILFIPVVVHGRVRSDRIKIESDLIIRQTTNGSIGLELNDSDVDLSGFRFQIDNIADAFTGLFEDTARQQGEKLLTKTMEDFVVPALFDEGLLSQEIEIMGKRIGVDLDVESVLTDSNGVSLILGSRVSVEQPLRQMGIVPTQIPPADRSGAQSIKIASSIDFINRLLLSAWSSGAFELELTTEAENLSAFGVPVLKVALAQAGQHLNADDVLTYRLRPLLPPIATIDKNGRPLRIEVCDAMLDIIGPQGLVVTVAIDLSVGVGLSATNGDQLLIAPELDITIAADVAEMPMGQVKESLLESQIETVAQLLPEMIADQTFNVGASDDEVPFKLFEVVFGSTSGHWLDVFARFEMN
jgi:hypothetical protein